MVRLRTCTPRADDREHRPAVRTMSTGDQLRSATLRFACTIGAHLSSSPLVSSAAALRSARSWNRVGSGVGSTAAVGACSVAICKTLGRRGDALSACPSSTSAPACPPAPPTPTPARPDAAFLRTCLRKPAKPVSSLSAPSMAAMAARAPPAADDEGDGLRLNSPSLTGSVRSAARRSPSLCRARRPRPPTSCTTRSRATSSSSSSEVGGDPAVSVALPSPRTHPTVQPTGRGAARGGRGARNAGPAVGTGQEVDEVHHLAVIVVVVLLLLLLVLIVLIVFGTGPLRLAALSGRVVARQSMGLPSLWAWPAPAPWTASQCRRRAHSRRR